MRFFRILAGSVIFLALFSAAAVASPTVAHVLGGSDPVPSATPSAAPPTSPPPEADGSPLPSPSPTTEPSPLPTTEPSQPPSTPASPSAEGGVGRHEDALGEGSDQGAVADCDGLNGLDNAICHVQHNFDRHPTKGLENALEHLKANLERQGGSGG
jgi:hypothetical protein